MDINNHKSWIGHKKRMKDQLTLMPVNALAATLNHDYGAALSGDLLPELWHWLYFLPTPQCAEIGGGGLPLRGVLPMIALPNCIWAGGRIEYIRSPQVGDEVERVSTILDVNHEVGQDGQLVFVTLQHEIFDDGGLLIREEQDLIYLDNAKLESPLSRPQSTDMEPLWTRTVNPDPVLLFRYSALTFNGHRIHYDRSYAQEVEGYPGLVVHAHLIATLLVDLLHEHLPVATMKYLSIRVLHALYDIAPFRLCGVPSEDGRSVTLWAEGPDGSVCMKATATLA
ncbi:hypothetical protein [Pseudomonas sp. BF-R-19]|uniref:hypothetical protein n=1 Tax=Pseudomonas sp. BF-R-19 TaxID=2832397 RepID=UPI001CC1902A|nr:hypothetical protein [Pseudomonas sp. BF-R-19]